MSVINIDYIHFGSVTSKEEYCSPSGGPHRLVSFCGCEVMQFCTSFSSMYGHVGALEQAEEEEKVAQRK